MKNLTIVFMILALFAISQSCKKDPVLATVTTKDATDVQYQTATLNGSVDDNGGGTVSERGFIYSTSNDLKVNNVGVIIGKSGSGDGTYSLNVTSLSPNTTYYFKAYAINEADTAYGAVLTFQTI